MDKISFKVVKKENGKFAPRIFSSICATGCWFKPPYEYDNLNDAVNALKKEANDLETYKRLQKEEIVFEL
jgi:hypothetical protein